MYLKRLIERNYTFKCVLVCDTHVAVLILQVNVNKLSHFELLIDSDLSR